MRPTGEEAGLERDHAQPQKKSSSSLPSACSPAR